MDLRIQLERIRRRVQLSAVELELQPEAFQATEELRIASGELASVIAEIGNRAEASERESCASLSFVSRGSGAVNHLGLSIGAWHPTR